MAKGKRVKKREKKLNAGVIAAVAAGVVAVAGVGGVAAYGANAAKMDTVYPNVYVSGVPVGGMTYDEALAALTAAKLSPSSDLTAAVELTDANTLVITARDAGYTGDIADAAKMAVDYGKGGGAFSSALSYTKSKSTDTDLFAGGSFDEAAVKAKIAEAAAGANHASVDDSYAVDADSVTVRSGTSGYTVDEAGVYDYVYKVFTENSSGDFFTDEFSEAKTATNGGKKVDLDKIYDEVYVEPKDAEYDPETGTVTAAVVGVSFDLPEAKRRYATLEAGKSMDIALVKTEPEVMVIDLDELLFRDLLAEKATSLSGSSSNRVNNITKAAEYINETVLQPGDVFSFNGVVGERTSAKGFKPAGAYVSGQTVDEIGGGICQVSSTIYYCVLMSELEEVERSNHMYSVAYLPLGFDATVNWGTLDFKFRNNKDYPIKILTHVEDGMLYVELWGTKTDDHVVKLEYSLIETISYETVEEESEEIKPGESKVKTSGHTGYVADSYQCVYDADGNLIAKNFIARNKYRAQNRVILVPVKAEEVDTENPEENPGEGEVPGEGNNPGEGGEPTTPDNPTTEPENPGESENPGEGEEPTEPENPPTEPETPPEENPGEDNGGEETPPEENPGETTPPAETEAPGDGDLGSADNTGEAQAPAETEETGETGGVVPEG